MENILIIEDNQDVNLMLAQAIKSSGYGVKSSFTGIDGLNEIKTNSYSLVLLDIMLPYKSGDEILKEVRQFSQIPIIIISAKDMISTKIDLLKLGADDYITKPFDLGEVIARIESNLRRYYISNHVSDSDILPLLKYKDITLDENNMTILISSHNLPEMYQLANDYIFINKGEIIETLTLEELDEHCKHYLLLQSTDVCKLVNVIERKLNTTNFKVMPDNSVQLFDYIDDKELVGKTLFENEVAVTNLSNEGGTLEDYFVSMVGGIDNV